MDGKKTTPLTPAPLTIYFYHTRLTTESYEEWKAYRFPGHLLYGQPLLEQYGIRSVMHRYKAFASRWKLTLYTTRQILFCRQKYQVLYGTSFRGLELIIFLRAIGLYRKPVVVWHHQSVRAAASKLREWASRLFYRGIDRAFFFSQRLMDDSLPCGKMPAERMQLVHWGPDLPFYDHLLQDHPRQHPHGFISTGKENRDMETLFRAFDAAGGVELDIYTAPANGLVNYRQFFEHHRLPECVRVHYTEGVIPYELAKKVAQRSVVVICCLEFPYTVGLTTLVEALALGLPVICSRNPYFGFDIDREEVGITVPYGDVEGWIAAILRLTEHPEEARRMGANARRLAEERFNLAICAREVAEALRAVSEPCKHPRR
ncbi:MAG: glycosyltransferase family 4 protein [Mediterranea sp.]|jgi:glycosyltransferase involved in cell wall biosynthesis|nr:glycosyltransferase family 4 protein [Mediterranea sp.]